MMTVYCHHSAEQFWNMTPRVVIAIIDQWKKIEVNRERLRVFISSGGDPDEVIDQEAVRRKELELGAALW
jgi:hypothetical protein